ncbi:MAG: M14 family zinc carboxypeptidase [Saprospiraceae bacterium]|nr:M14 family zinc carboxypeptidase [Saprospiraceae bacterium]
MNKLLSVFFTLLFFSSTVFGQGLKSPTEFLRTDYGKHFTPHYLVADYVRHVAENSDRVTFIEYGETNEDRPLLLATITTPQNHSNLDEIQNYHLFKIGMKDEVTVQLEENFAVVWLSFGVHGNEAGGSESSMNVLYKLANPANGITGDWLRNTIVLFDPSLNPDGYNRYTQWARSIGGKTPHPGLTDREHMEPWPGGRVNHYYFDLNRDWAWQTQVESQQRIAQYQKWMPHVHVDFHEMGYDQGYYFAPAAEPYHQHITDFQRDMQVDIGKNHAKYFDREGWLYFTREVFDLLYPSYGDTYPTFNGAVGMTYEQAGHGMSGREISLSNGDTLKIQDRIDHHTQTALSTIEEASRQVNRISKNFERYFANAVAEPKGTYKSYVIKKSEKANRLATLLTKNNIRFYRTEGGGTLSGYNYNTSKSGSFELEEGDMVINANQPNGTLLQVLMEPEPLLSDSVTYDITAWSLPHAYGVQAYALDSYTSTQSVNLDENRESPFVCFGNQESVQLPYAYIIPWNSVTSAQILSKLYNDGIKARMADKDISFEEGVVEKGSIVIVRGDNYFVEDLPGSMEKIGGECSDCFCLSSGFSSEGGDIGGGSFSRLSHPKVLLLSGRGTSPYNVGQVWHYFDEVVGYPLSIVDKLDMGRVDLDDFNTLILPDGWYSLSESELSDVSEFVSEGGKVIAISGALGNFVDKDDFALSKYASEDEKKAAKKEREEKKLAARDDSYQDQERRGISNSIPGAVVRNTIDASHPLAFGLGDSYHSMKTSRQYYSLLKDSWNVITVPEDYESFGFIGVNLKSKIANSVSFAVEEKGGGNLIYMVDNPLYRGFWENGSLLFSNALFLVN